MTYLGNRVQLRLEIIHFFETVIKTWYQSEFDFIESLELSTADEKEEKIKLLTRVLSKSLTLSYLKQALDPELLWLITHYSEENIDENKDSNVIRSNILNSYINPSNKLIVFIYHITLYKMRLNIFSIIKGDEDKDFEKKAWALTANFLGRCTSANDLFEVYDIYQKMVEDGVYTEHNESLEVSNQDLENHRAFEKLLDKLDKVSSSKKNNAKKNQLQILFDKKKDSLKPKSDAKPAEAKEAPPPPSKGFVRSILEEFWFILFGAATNLVAPPPPPPEEKKE